MMEGETKFDAKRYLTQLKGKDYLEVKWRLLWLRTERPDAVIVTDLQSRDEKVIIFKARVTIPGGGVATGWAANDAREDKALEKCETAALGRALGALGYGTQFCEDFESGPVDSGVVHQQQRGQQPKAQQPKAEEAEPFKAVRTEAEVQKLAALAKRKGKFNVLEDWMSRSGKTLHEMNEATYNVNKKTLEELPDAPAPLEPAPTAETKAPTPYTEATPAQIKAIYSIAWQEYEMNEDEMDQRARELYGVPVKELSKAQASECITRLKETAGKAATR